MASLVGCHDDQPNYKKKLNVDPGPAPDVEYSRYEEVLFNLDTAHFQQEVKAIQKDFNVFLDGDLDNPDAVRYVREFVTDPTIVLLYQKVKQADPDLDEVDAIVGSTAAVFATALPLWHCQEHTTNRLCSHKFQV